MKDKIIIFGVGCAGRAIYRSLKNECIIGFVDNNLSLSGKHYDNKPIYSFEELKTISFDKIAVSGVWIDSMLEQLESLNIPNEKVLKISDCDVEFSSEERDFNTDLLMSELADVFDFLKLNYYVIGSSLATLFRAKKLSTVADVDVFLTSQNDAKVMLDYLSAIKFNERYDIQINKHLADTPFEESGSILRVIVKSKVSKETEEPAIVDISIASDYKDNYFVMHGDKYIYIPKHMCNGERLIDYMNSKLKIPFLAEEYLSLLYGKNWFEPPKKWDQSDYGNLMTLDEVYKIKEQ